MLIKKIGIIFNSNKKQNKYLNLETTKQRMQTPYLISKEMDNLLFLDVINEDFLEQSKLISILISSLIQQSPLLNIYEEKKKLLLDTLNSQRANEKNLFREVSSFNFLKNTRKLYWELFYFKIPKVK